MRKESSFGIIPVRYVSGKWEVFLIQHQSGHWSLPKGHQEVEETGKETAIRELFEETGLSVSRLLREEPFYEYYKFKVQNELIDKTVGYFLAEVTGSEKIDLNELKSGYWSNFDNAVDVATYSQMKTLLKNIHKILKMYDKEQST